MVDLGIKYCFIEVSSHGISQHRIEGLNFSGGVFTNITHDHLDYHGTFTNYRDVKKHFFDILKFSTISNLKLESTVILLKSLVLGFAKIRSATSF